MADAVLLVRIHLAESDVVAGRHEHGIIAEAPLAAGRPDEAAVDPPFEPFAMAVRPAQSERADEMGDSARLGAERFQTLLHSPHGEAEIAARLCIAVSCVARHGPSRG